MSTDLINTEALSTEDVLEGLKKLNGRVSKEDIALAALLVTTPDYFVDTRSVRRYLNGLTKKPNAPQLAQAHKMLQVLTICADGTDMRESYVTGQLNKLGFAA